MHLYDYAFLAFLMLNAALFMVTDPFLAKVVKRHSVGVESQNRALLRQTMFRGLSIVLVLLLVFTFWQTRSHPSWLAWLCTTACAAGHILLVYLVHRAAFRQMRQYPGPLAPRAAS